MWHGGDELVNKVVIFVFFAHKKYSRSFVKLRLNPWCHMDYFNDLLATFLSLDGGSMLAVYGRVRELSDFIKNILICALKMNEGLTGLKTTRGWVINDSILIFGWTIPLKCNWLLWSKLYFQHHYSSLQCHMIFRNHLLLKKHFWLLPMLKTVVYFCGNCDTFNFFQDYLMNRKFKRTAFIWNRNTL